MIGRFITFEGGEGAGKTTQIRRLARRLEEAGRTVVTTREPGGTELAEAIRRVLLSGALEAAGAEVEAVLFAAARANHVDRVIAPALAEGVWVLCDRFTDSTRVYQGAIGGVDDAVLDALDRVAVGTTRPDLTLVLDVAVEVGLGRVLERSEAAGEVADRFEREGTNLHERRRRAFLAIAASDPGRCVVVDAEGAPSAVAEDIWRIVTARFARELA